MDFISILFVCANVVAKCNFLICPLDPILSILRIYALKYVLLCALYYPYVLFAKQLIIE